MVQIGRLIVARRPDVRTHSPDLGGAASGSTKIVSDVAFTADTGNVPSRYDRHAVW